METSLFLAKVLGLYLIIIIPAVVINRKHLHAFVDELTRSIALSYVLGFFALVVGLLVVLTHNVWTFDWRGLITVLGWLAIAKGIMRLYVPEIAMNIAKKFTTTAIVWWCAPFFVIGLYLIYVGFGLNG
ncbi:hypothetical protein A2673_01245 [Candidatus Kaiserbacteria bacterium RIFCSPHIGHO2_01_FULL_50_13]|uniref:Uncharacterized protein n=1 Tax=Candidatus Kaiserbacteria bacterium RIFCSPLOWO2_01_FULL_50_24 TaxID=1798507 RepID=A0A1F6ENB6_9BACT|nr:MAG: hypothetical protein A2673_01245 [Candidatus Kaiserbacteria bacterium RIFCSPHIGHO2_01_FULL_50_13]OGG75125.1 MAG: hypothetical protein A3A34_02095 [Candidatus Kaiserbacteria bacterium RIFCSPLOWO2_01_FULL_50_24]OGG82223.1 MAG: hypothetical protein A3H74_02565 [Candidatus Kaiserbacteria bacterium RIFCSPLOWO2_02_FULL_51_13]